MANLSLHSVGEVQNTGPSDRVTSITMNIGEIRGITHLSAGRQETATEIILSRVGALVHATACSSISGNPYVEVSQQGTTDRFNIKKGTLSLSLNGPSISREVEAYILQFLTPILSATAALSKPTDAENSIQKFRIDSLYHSPSITVEGTVIVVSKPKLVHLDVCNIIEQ